MKQLIRRLSRVADSSSSAGAHYCLLRPSADSRPSRTDSFRAKLRRRAFAANSSDSSSSSSSSSSAGAVPSGHVPVYVGEEMERFVVSAEILNHPVFVELLERYSAQEYGYEQQGVLRIPCHVILFERVLESLRLGQVPQWRDLGDLLGGGGTENDVDFGLYGVVSA